jgi:cytochrome c oxidase cbb3-type subunit III
VLARLAECARVSGLTLVMFSGAALVAALAVTACAEPAKDALIRHETTQVDARFEAGAAAWSKYCALCHGPEGHGYAADHAPSLVSATFLESASDEFIARGIREGRPGTAMAAYGKVRGGPLNEEEITSIVTFLRERGPTRVPLHQSHTAVVGDSARGEAIYKVSCQSCHGTRTDRGNAVHLANTTFLAAATDAFLRHAVVHGRPGTPMPPFQGVLSEEEIDDVVAFLRSWARPVRPERQAPPEPPPLGEVVIHPAGKAPEFTLRADRFVPIDQVKKALDEKRRIVIIDARAPSDWFSMHIPGSISVPYYAFDRLDAIPKDGTWVTAYCACPHHASGAVVDELRKRGYTNTAILDEGILEWKKRGYPLDSEPPPP